MCHLPFAAVVGFLSPYVALWVLRVSRRELPHNTHSTAELINDYRAALHSLLDHSGARLDT